MCAAAAPLRASPTRRLKTRAPHTPLSPKDLDTDYEAPLEDLGFAPESGGDAEEGYNLPPGGDATHDPWTLTFSADADAAPQEDAPAPEPPVDAPEDAPQPQAADDAEDGLTNAPAEDGQVDATSADDTGVLR